MDFQYEIDGSMGSCSVDRQRRIPGSMLGGIIEGCGSGPEEMNPMLVGIAELW